MFNILLDRLPDEYEGFLIRTDYRIGIQISQALADDELESYERVSIALSLLYGNGMPDAKTAYEGLKWFMRCGAEVKKMIDADGDKVEDTEDDENEIDYFSFDYDSSRLYSSFRRTYGIELDRERMHWFRFISMMADLGDCAFTQVIGYRAMDTTGMDGKTKATYNKMKRKFALPQPISEEEQEFMAKLAQ